ncbi:acyl-CoA dehydrogenase [Cryobacterium sp. TMT1-2-1]|uniref:acyl-CoA dehydrogenase family protein n=1 Tax=Cryobacterium sp. TMT1-2-1 TaxID=1259232 RepID=UPI001069C1BF|nr:acyl-CoA dehydrogenase family protein [Cryobacterium sp. TMT1-2-1]TFD41212.1 acyl-CoA dehydrogenase [Cryobacterium sp. TMT1-2-1]
MTDEQDRAPVWLTGTGDRSGSGDRTKRRDSTEHARLGELAAAASSVEGDAGRALALARRLGASVAGPGDGNTRQLFEALATLAAADLTAARVAEAHLDALSILGQAGVDPAGLPGAPAGGGTWGVFAAEARGARLTARQADGGRWLIDGTKPWCSLAGSLSHALVTAHTSETSRRLFAVDLAHPGVVVHEGTWVARGLPAVPSGPVDFRDLPAVPVGDDEWYLRRLGFAWGGIGVAACWWGGAVGVARRVFAAAREREPDQIALAHLGALDVLLSAAGGSLAAAATAIDAGTAAGVDGAILAARVRGLVARTVDEVIARTGHALGPAPLALDARHAQRVADLQLYVRQHHAERDDAALGRMLLTNAPAPW